MSCIVDSSICEWLASFRPLGQFSSPAGLRHLSSYRSAQCLVLAALADSLNHARVDVVMSFLVLFSGWLSSYRMSRPYQSLKRLLLAFRHYCTFLALFARSKVFNAPHFAAVAPSSAAGTRQRDFLRNSHGADNSASLVVKEPYCSPENRKSCCWH